MIDFLTLRVLRRPLDIINLFTFQLFTGGGGSSTTKTEPWKKAQPFMVGGKYDPTTGMYGVPLNKKGNATGPLGTINAASNYFTKYQNLSPEQQALNDQYMGALGDRDRQSRMAYGDVANDLMSGRYNPTATTNAYTADQTRANAYTADQTRANAYTADQARANAYTADQTRANAYKADLTRSDAFTGDMTRGRAGQGALDPTNALRSLLSGKIDNPYLSGIHQSYINDSLRGYGDAVQDFTQQVMPSIDNNAFAAGQYGGSRQGVAQGLAGQQMLRNARDLGIAAMDSGNRLYGNAYESAQGRMAGTAGDLNNQAYGMEQYNAGNLQSSSLANAAAANQMAQYNASNQQAVDLANAAAANEMARYNATNQQAIDLANAAAANQIAQYNATNRQAVDLANAAAANQLSQYNATNRQDIDRINAAAANQLSQYNATNRQNADQYNATLDLQQKEAAAKNATQGLDVMSTGHSALDNIFNQRQSLLAAPQMQYLNALNNYAGVITPGAALGSTVTTPSHGSAFGNVMSGLTTAAGLLSALKAK